MSSYAPKDLAGQVTAVAATAPAAAKINSNMNPETKESIVSELTTSSTVETKPMPHVVSNANVKPPSPPVNHPTTAMDIDDAPVAVSQDYSVAAATDGAPKLESRDISLSPDFIIENNNDAKVASAHVPTKPAPITATTTVDPRRTGRKRTSTTMIIDGHTVKVANNYTVTAGEYIHGAYKPDAPKPVKKAKPATTNKPKSSSPRKMPAYITARTKHNDTIKSRITSHDTPHQLNFMTNNYDALEPFIDNKVKSMLQSNIPKAKPEVKRAVLGTQPDLVQTTLRDYQMIGLDWMVNMWGMGMPFILGDEMGLGMFTTPLLLCVLA